LYHKIVSYITLGLALSVLLSVFFDQIGVLDLTGKKIDLVIFLLGILIIDLIVDHSSRLNSIDKKLDVIEKQKIGDIDRFIDKELKDILGNYIAQTTSNLNALVNENSFVVENLDEFANYYHRTLVCFSKSSFVATSDLHGSKFWDSETARAVRNFTSGGGKMSRVFFISSSEHCFTKEELAILQEQIENGVKISLIPLDKISASDYENFIAEKNGAVAWKVDKMPSGEINRIQITSNTKEVKRLVSKFEQFNTHTAAVKVETIKTLNRAPSERSQSTEK